MCRLLLAALVENISSPCTSALLLQPSPRFILFFFFYPSRPLFITLLVNFYYYTFHSGKPAANSIYSACQSPAFLALGGARHFSRLARSAEEMQMWILIYTLITPDKGLLREERALVRRALRGNCDRLQDYLAICMRLFAVCAPICSHLLHSRK